MGRRENRRDRQNLSAIRAGGRNRCQSQGCRARIRCWLPRSVELNQEFGQGDTRRADRPEGRRRAGAEKHRQACERRFHEGGP